MKGRDMEPTTSAAGAASFGGTAAAAGIGAALAAVVVMCMSLPRTAREWTVALISTVAGSMGGGAVVIKQLGLERLATDEIGLMAIIGIAFASGLPAWAVVRWLFAYLERRRERDIAEVAEEVRRFIDRGNP